MLLPADVNSMVSPPSRRAASEKLFRVRVEFSKNRLAQVFPCKAVNLRRKPSVANLNAAAVSKTSTGLYLAAVTATQVGRYWVT
jgi:hypothetical protein